MFLLVNDFSWSFVWPYRTVPDRAAASKELDFKTTAPLRAAPDVLEIDAARFDPARVDLACERLDQSIINQEGANE